jgi:ankyrin repeat protein
MNEGITSMQNRLHEAAKDQIKGHTRVPKLIKDGADVNAVHTEYQTTATEFAAQSGNTSTLEILLNAGANIDASQKQRNLLHWALQNSPDVIKYISRPEIYEKFNDGTTALHAAAAAGRFDEVRAILAQDPKKIWEKNKRGETLLYWAAAGEQEEIFKFILNHDEHKLGASDQIDEELRKVADILNITASHYYDTDRKPEAIHSYKNAIIYRESIANKNNDDHKALAYDYTNLADCFLHQYAVEKQDDTQKSYAIRHALENYSKGKGEAELIADASDIDRIKLLDDCGRGLTAIPVLLRNQSGVQSRKPYRSAPGSLVDRYMPDRGPVVGAPNYHDSSNLDHAVDGWQSNHSRPREFSLFGKYSKYNPLRVAHNIALFAAAKRKEDEEMAAAIAASRLDSNEAAKEKASLIEQAGDFGFNVIPQDEDGNCAYHAVAHQLNIQNVAQWKGITQEQLRKLAADHLSECKSLYDHTILPEDSEEKNMHRDTVWASDHALTALSRALNVNLFILQSCGQVDKKGKKIERPAHVIKQEKAIATVYLGYEFPRHYQSLVPVNNDFQANDVIKSMIDYEPVDLEWKNFKQAKIDEAAAKAASNIGQPLPSMAESLPLMQFAPVLVPASAVPPLDQANADQAPNVRTPSPMEM